MVKKGRLIENLRKQKQDTVLKYLNRLGTDKVVYSKHLKGLEPYFNDNNVYIYACASEVVVVCFDKFRSRDELADETPSDGKTPLYFSANDFRVSPVWQLSETIKLLKEQLKAARYMARIYGMFLTGSCIINYSDMEETWNDMSIKVIHELKNLNHHRLKTNEDEKLEEKHIVAAMLRSAKVDMQLNLFDEPGAAKSKIEKPDIGVDAEEEFDRLLNEYADSVLEKEGIKESGPFFDEEIEQNLNTSVQVRVLRPIGNPWEELDKLVGCEDIKHRIDELLTLSKYNKMLRLIFPDSKQHEVSLHSVFLGRPGPGKTTVCKIFGSLLRQAGALSKGHVVICDRSTFIGTLWGDEERSMRQVLNMAQGGVLMIDEAYLFNGRHEHDPGKLVIQLLMNILADETQRDIAIVLCGYKEPMEKLLGTNPGLESRLPNRFEFADFTVDELLEITLRRVKEYEYEFTPPAWEKYKQILIEAYQQRNPNTWGNARFVANQLERIYIQHASRCVKKKTMDKNLLRKITSDDILPIDVPKERKRIGF